LEALFEETAEQSVVVLSSTGAEFLALSTAASELI